MVEHDLALLVHYLKHTITVVAFFYSSVNTRLHRKQRSACSHYLDKRRPFTTAAGKGDKQP